MSTQGCIEADRLCVVRMAGGKPVQNGPGCRRAGMALTLRLVVRGAGVGEICRDMVAMRLCS